MKLVFLIITGILLIILLNGKKPKSKELPDNWKKKLTKADNDRYIKGAFNASFAYYLAWLAGIAAVLVVLLVDKN